MKILVTGAAGFIGFHVCRRLLSEGYEIYGIDSINDYYDIRIKYARLNILKEHKNFRFTKADIYDIKVIDSVFSKFKPDKVIHLAAQAGVRYSIENPFTYTRTNIDGFQNIIECCKYYKIQKLVYASSSSVYGSNNKYPFTEDQPTENPISLYAATKKSNELVAHTYSHLFGMKTIGLRFFTVYGPFGRPDMALYKFCEAIRKDEPINLFNNGDMYRDFTYIDDIVDGVILSMNTDTNEKIFNLGRGRMESLKNMIRKIEFCFDKKIKINYLPMQPGDVEKTISSIEKAKSVLGYNPKIIMEDGIERFVEWYKNYIKNTGKNI